MPKNIKKYISHANRLKLREKEKIKANLIAKGYKELPGKFWVDPKGFNVYREFNYHFRVSVPKKPLNKYKYKTISYLNTDHYFHRLVYKAHNGQIPEFMTVDHIDGDRFNNHKDNLQLVTREDNSRKTILISHAKGKLDGQNKPIAVVGTDMYFKSIADMAKWIHKQEPHRSFKAIRVALAKGEKVGKFKGRFVRKSDTLYKEK